MMSQQINIVNNKVYDKENKIYLGNAITINYYNTYYTFDEPDTSSLYIKYPDGTENTIQLNVDLITSTTNAKFYSFTLPTLTQKGFHYCNLIINGIKLPEFMITVW